MASQSVSFGLIVRQLITGRADVEGAAAILRPSCPEGRGPMGLLLS